MDLLRQELASGSDGPISGSASQVVVRGWRGVFSCMVARALTRAAASTNQKIVHPPPCTRAAESAAPLLGLEAGVQRSADRFRIRVQD